ncbi:MAG: aldehyde dehydrogenase [Negativicutes bacterium]|jgi:aldehyde dehydrogenase (NAD+)
MNISQIDNVFSAQQAYFASGATRSLKFRVTMLKRLSCAIQEHEQVIFNALKLDLGKPEFEAYASEIGFVLSDIDHTVAKLPKWYKDERVASPLLQFPARSKVVSEPLGLTLIIGPWNYPFQLIMAPLIGAIAAGNCAIVKPANISANVAEVIRDLLEHTFSSEYIACIMGGRDANTALLNKPFDLIFYTGNPEVGRSVMAAAAKHLTPVVLELGGKSPCIVDKNINLEIAVNRLVWAKYFNAGQTCVAPDYVYVHKDIKAEFLAKVIARISKTYGDDPQQSESLGRIVNDKHFVRLCSYLESERILAGGITNAKTRYFSPTVIDNVNWQSKVMQDEIFGPIMPILEYENIDECIAAINRNPKPLALYVFSNDRHLTDRLIRQTSSGGVCINDCIVHMATKNLPFGGVGNSGLGKYHGKYSFECFSQKKAVMSRSTWLDIPLRYAPYPKLHKWLKLLIRYLG